MSYPDDFVSPWDLDLTEQLLNLAAEPCRIRFQYCRCYFFCILFVCLCVCCFCCVFFLFVSIFVWITSLPATPMTHVRISVFDWLLLSCEFSRVNERPIRDTLQTSSRLRRQGWIPVLPLARWSCSWERDVGALLVTIGFLTSNRTRWSQSNLPLSNVSRLYR